MGNEKITTIRLPRDLYNELVKRKRPHQAIAGVIEELLNRDDKTMSQTNHNEQHANPT